MPRFARAKGSKSSNLKTPDNSTPWEVMKEQLLQAKKESEDNKNRLDAEKKRIENYSNFLKEQKILKRKATWCEFPEGDGSKKEKEHSTSEEVKCIKKKKKSNVECISESPHKVDNTQEIMINESSHDNTSKKVKKKKNKSRDKPSESEPNNENIKTNQVHQDQNPQEESKLKKKNKKKQAVDISDITTKAVVTENEINKQTNGNQKKKPKKKRGDQPTRRKEIDDRSFQLIINGKEVELMRYDGFPIMKKDAERLNELRSNMMKKGIPKSEVNRTIKLERRRAEKALARLKRDVCYNCRKGGHNLSDCPELKSNIPGVDAADGICFKCGSTEHRQFECKVQRDKEFRFANCFICKEQGHIARQCPDNPKGLYPNGGCCKICGDVTHLRKDCPTVQNKEGTSIKLQMLDTGSNIEDMEFQSNLVSEEAPRKPKKIKF